MLDIEVATRAALDEARHGVGEGADAEEADKAYRECTGATGKAKHNEKRKEKARNWSTPKYSHPKGSLVFDEAKTE